MYAIDEAKNKFVAAESLSKLNVAGHEARIRNLNERGTSLSAELKVIQGELDAVRTRVSPVARRAARR